MSTLNDLQAKNPKYPIQGVSDPAFAKYGVVYPNYQIDEVTDYMGKNVPLSNEGNTYVPSNPDLEKLGLIQAIGEDIYAGLPIEAGECTGQTTSFSAIEYHQGSEVNIMLTDVVMVLGKRQDLEPTGKFFASRDAELFFIPAGTVVEFYSDTLHYSPIKVHDSGFSAVVILPALTNQALPAGFTSSNPRIVKLNKFQLVHESRQDKIDLGVQIGVTGPMIELTPLAD